VPLQVRQTKEPILWTIHGAVYGRRNNHQKNSASKLENSYLPPEADWSQNTVCWLFVLF
jgi:hypothetical protein